MLTSVLETSLRGLGALKSCTLVPLIRGSYVGSLICVFIGSGNISGAFWLVLLLISSVDMGFFKKGNPFFPFWDSITVAVMARLGGSLISLVPAGRFPVAPEEA